MFNLLGVQPEVLRQNALWSLTGRPAIRRAVESVQPDIVLASSPSPAAMLASAAVMRRSPIPFVVELRDLWAGNPHYDGDGELLRGIQARVFARADAVVCVTGEARDRLLALHPEIEDRLHVVPNGYDPRLLELRGANGALPDGRITLIHAGALYGGRSIGALLEALERPGLRGRVRLDLVGTLDRENAEQLRRPRPGVEVRTLPPTTWEDAVRRTQEADIALVVFTPGDDTAVPGKLYEALALGKPVLALTGEKSATAALLGRVGRDSGCARHDDPDSIAAALARLLEHPPEPLPADEIAHWDRAANARRLAGVLDGLAGRPAARG